MNNSQHARTPAKRIAAIAAIVLLAGMYIVTLVSAVFSFPGADMLFRASLGLTIAVPVMAWLVIWMIGLFRGEKTIADPQILQSSPAERKKMEDAILRELGPLPDPSAADSGEISGKKTD